MKLGDFNEIESPPPKKNLGHKMYDSGNIGIYKIIHKVYSAGSPLHDNSTKIGPYKIIH